MNSPDNPDKGRALAAAMERLIQGVRLMDARQQQRDQWMRESDARVEELAVRARGHAAEVRENGERGEVRAVLAQAEACLARFHS